MHIQKEVTGWVVQRRLFPTKALHCWTSLTQLYSNASFLFCTVSCHDMQLDACVQCWAMTIRQLFKMLWFLKYVYTSGITPQKLCKKASWEFCKQSTFYWKYWKLLFSVCSPWVLSPVPCLYVQIEYILIHWHPLYIAFYFYFSATSLLPLLMWYNHMVPQQAAN